MWWDVQIQVLLWGILVASWQVKLGLSTSFHCLLEATSKSSLITWVSFQQLKKCILTTWKQQFWDVLCLQGLIYIWLKAAWFGFVFSCCTILPGSSCDNLSAQELVWAGLLDTMMGTRQNRECTEEIIAVRVMLSPSPAIHVYLVCPCAFLMKNWEWRKRTWA